MDLLLIVSNNFANIHSLTAGFIQPRRRVLLNPEDKQRLATGLMK